jgi:GrpB-like predicted nucleotidyltransferase (UPF0157 family)
VVKAMQPQLEAADHEPRAWIAHDHIPDPMIKNAADWEKRFFTSGAQTRPSNIHVRRLGAANQRYALLFRDYLRAHPLSAAWLLLLLICRSTPK